MKNTVSVSTVVSADINTVWEYVSDFNDASHQTIAVTNTEII
jgi:hypothetical protein